MSLRSRLALIFGALAIAVSLVVGVSAFRSTRAELESATDAFLVMRASDISDGRRDRPNDGRNGGRQGDQNDGQGSDHRETTLPFDPDAIVQILDRSGEITASSGGTLPVTEISTDIASAGPDRNRRSPAEFEDIEVDGESYRMFTQGTSDGAVQVARSTQENEDILDDLVRRFSLITIVVALVASAVGWWIARRTTKPLRQLSDVAADVADTKDFTTRIDVDRHDEIGQLASSFASMLAALETSREQQHRLIHDAGHELRTPLTSLSANVALLERADDLPDADKADLISAVRAELGELNELFDELIELATDRYDESSLPTALIDLDEIVRSTVKRWEHRTDRPISVESTPAVVRADQAMLERALTNLLSNADKFSPPGESVTVVAGGGSVAVRDRGPGIEPEERERVFDRFYRSDRTRSMPGSGLGLAIVAQIIEQLGGEVWAGESPDGSAEVGFRLPVDRSELELP